MVQAWSIEFGACKSETDTLARAVTVGMPKKTEHPSEAKERNQERLREWSLR